MKIFNCKTKTTSNNDGEIPLVKTVEEFTKDNSFKPKDIQSDFSLAQVLQNLISIFKRK